MVLDEKIVRKFDYFYQDHETRSLNIHETLRGGSVYLTGEFRLVSKIRRHRIDAVSEYHIKLESAKDCWKEVLVKD